MKGGAAVEAGKGVEAVAQEAAGEAMDGMEKILTAEAKMVKMGKMAEAEGGEVGDVTHLDKMDKAEPRGEKEAKVACAGNRGECPGVYKCLYTIYTYVYNVLLLYVHTCTR